MVCAVHHLVCGKTRRALPIGIYASWIWKSVHSLPLGFIWSLHKRQKTGPGHPSFLLFFTFLQGLEVSCRKTKVSAANSAKHHQQRSLCQSRHHLEWEHMCPKIMMTVWLQTEPKINHLFVMDVWVSVLGMTFCQTDDADKYSLKKKKAEFHVERRSSLFPVSWAVDITKSFMQSSLWLIPLYCQEWASFYNQTFQIWQTKHKTRKQRA